MQQHESGRDDYDTQERDQDSKIKLGKKTRFECCVSSDRKDDNEGGGRKCC